MKKSFVQKSNMAISTFLVIGIAVIINFFSYQIFFRWDLTQNKDFSISQATKDTLGELDDLVNIKVYFSKNLPSQFLGLRQNVQDILDGYANYSDGKLRAEYVDPADNADDAAKLAIIGIPELQFQVYDKDQLQLVKGYLGIAVQYGDQTEVIPVVRDTNSLEYQITMAIKKVISSAMPKIGMLSSNGVKEASDIETARKKLEELYEIWDVDLAKVDDIYKEIKSLVIIGPTKEFSEAELKKIDNFVMNGGSLLVLSDGVKVDNNLQAVENKTGLEKLLADYGITINKDLVLESKGLAAIASFNTGFFQFSTQYPYWPRVIKAGFDQENSAVSRLENVNFQWVSSIDIDENKFGENVSISKLAQTSEKSWKQTGTFNLNPQQNFTSSGKMGKSLIAVWVGANFKSPYGEESKASSKIVVVGDSDFIGNNMAQEDNLVFFQNLVDSLSLDNDLIEIRSKGITERPLQADLSDGMKNSLRYGNIFGMTFLVIIFGLVRYYLRRKAKFADEL